MRGRADEQPFSVKTEGCLFMTTNIFTQFSRICYFSFHKLFTKDKKTIKKALIWAFFG